MSPQLLAPWLKALGVDPKALQEQVATIAKVAAGLDARLTALEQTAKLNTLQLEVITRLLSPTPLRATGPKPKQLDLIEYIDCNPSTSKETP